MAITDPVLDHSLDQTYPASDPPTPLRADQEPQTPMSEEARRYNYERFGRARNEVAFHMLHEYQPLGADPLGVSYFSLDGARIERSHWLERPLVLEIASYSEPCFWRNNSRMNHLARQFPDIRFAILYVREAHPGDHFPPHRSLAQKLEQASQLQTRVDPIRQVIVDHLDGRGHRILGGLPQSVFVFDRQGRERLRLAWNDPELVQLTLLEQGMSERDVPPLGENLPQPSTWQCLRILNRTVGPKAAWDFLVCVPERWHYHRQVKKFWREKRSGAC